MNASKSIRKQLQEIADSSNTIKAFVAQEALNYTSDNVISFFQDLAQHGCICGMVPSLVYYADTEAFFDNYYEEILDIKSEFEEATGTPLKIPHQVKNYLSWFAFEQVAYQLTIELGLEI
ncbi:DUF7222 domain-containing protein [Tenacibaculum xiamenense]|uniref:DUF7222 domain-containing protein n=1 Tax=Tenacibaculum xiamenense TaxID=1261553 RepID=UPI0038948A00